MTRALWSASSSPSVGTALSLLTTILLAYALSRPGSSAHRPLLLVVLFSLLFTPGIIPSYLVVKSLGLLDTYWALLAAGHGQRVQRRRPAGVLPGAAEGGDRERPARRRRRARHPRPDRPAAEQGGARGDRPLLRRGLLERLLLRPALPQRLRRSGRCSWCCAPTWSTRPSSASTSSAPAARSCRPRRRSRWPSWCSPSCRSCVVYPFLQRHFTKGVLTGAVKG